MDRGRNAAEFGPICPQTAGAVFTTRASRESEDCLYLNVWTRSLDSQAGQPVMVWIHGGGYLGGGERSNTVREAPCRRRC